VKRVAAVMLTAVMDVDGAWNDTSKRVKYQVYLGSILF
jgi:hypothetical protein